MVNLLLWVLLAEPAAKPPVPPQPPAAPAVAEAALIERLSVNPPPGAKEPEPVAAAPKPATGKPQRAPQASPRKSNATDTDPEFSEPVLPPALATPALCDEIRLSAQDRKVNRAKMDEERARLDRLAAEISQARAALKKETAELESLMKKAGPAAAHEAQLKKAAASAPAPEAANERPPVEALARTVRGMRPEQAAAVLAHLDRSLSVDLLRHIRPAEAGPIVEKLKPETAAALFTMMASKGSPRGAP